MITATFTKADQGDDMPCRIEYMFEYSLLDVPVASSHLVNSKVRTVDRFLAPQQGDTELRPHERDELMFDLALACGELIALMKAAEPHQHEGHQLRTTVSCLPDAIAVLEAAYERLHEHAKTRRPVLNIPTGLDPSKSYWKVTADPLVGIDWSVIGKTEYVTV